MNSAYGRALPLLLLIEGEAHGPQSVKALLAAAPDVLAAECVSTVEAGLRRLAVQPVTAVLLDLSLPEVSVGISLCPEDGQDAQSLIMHADAAMYHTKNSGRNRVGFYRSYMSAPAEERSSSRC